MTHPKRKKEPGAACSKLLRSFRFIATLELFADTLPHLSNLSRVFQTRSLDFSAIAAALNVTRAAVTVKAELASAVKDHVTAAVAPAAPAPVDPLMVKIEEKLAELRDREIEIAYDDPRWRRNWAGIRAQWLRALLDQVDHRFPATQLFADLATLFDPVKLPATLAAAIGSGHGDEAIKRLAEILSHVRPALPQLAEQLSIAERTAAEHKKATKSAAKADGDGDVEMRDSSPRANPKAKAKAKGKAKSAGNAKSASSANKKAAGKRKASAKPKTSAKRKSKRAKAAASASSDEKAPFAASAVPSSWSARARAANHPSASSPSSSSSSASSAPPSSAHPALLPPNAQERSEYLPVGGVDTAVSGVFGTIASSADPSAPVQQIATSNAVPRQQTRQTTTSLDADGDEKMDGARVPAGIRRHFVATEPRRKSVRKKL